MAHFILVNRKKWSAYKMKGWMTPTCGFLSHVCVTFLEGAIAVLEEKMLKDLLLLFLHIPANKLSLCLFCRRLNLGQRAWNVDEDHMHMHGFGSMSPRRLYWPWKLFKCRFWCWSSRFLPHLQKQHPSFTYEVIVVDDGSRDKTTEVGLLMKCF